MSSSISPGIKLFIERSSAIDREGGVHAALELLDRTDEDTLWATAPEDRAHLFVDALGTVKTASAPQQQGKVREEQSRYNEEIGTAGTQISSADEDISRDWRSNMASIIDTMGRDIVSNLPWMKLYVDGVTDQAT